MKVLCGKSATHRYTWPGRDESFTCEEHTPVAQGICSAMGMYLQFIPVHQSDQDGETCRQMVNKS